MTASPVRKNKIVLSDYNYRKDIENRLLMADLSIFEVDVLREILNSSLKISLKQLAEILDTDQEDITPVIHKLSSTKLVTLQGDTILVDKEMRKYYESQILKFDDHFEPGMEFLQGLLSKVPIHVLPTWYSISRSSDNIFTSIVEKYLLTPKIYERYLQEVYFDNPVMHQIIDDVFKSPDFKVPAKSLIEKYGLNREEFEECLLLLEFNIVCCLSYSRINNMWVEVVTPFFEWREYLCFQRDIAPQPITDIEKIERKHPKDFGFVMDITQILKALQKKPLRLDQVNEKYLMPKSAPGINLGNTTEEYLECIVDKIVLFQLAEIKDRSLILLDRGSEWIKKPIQDQALTVYKLPVDRCIPKGIDPAQFSERDMREVEKGLKRVLNSGWIYFEDFMKGFISPIGKAEPVTLKNRGKRWKYMLPSYSEDEKAMIQNTICGRLFGAGMNDVGYFNGKLCFCVTPMGRMTFGE